MKDVEIFDALSTAVAAAVAASIVPNLPVKYPSLTFTPPNDQKYLEAVFIPNNRENDFWATGKNYQGMFRLVLHWPADGTGAMPPMQTLASICARFYHGQMIGPVQITTEPNLTGVLEEGTEILYPASIRYTSFRL